MGLFKKRIDPRPVLKHIVSVTTQASLEDTDEARQRAADHLVADLNGLDRHTLIRVAALAAMCEGDARADHIKALAKHTAHHLISDLEAMAEAHAAAEGSETAPEAQDPLDVPEAPEEAAQAPGDDVPGAGWSEDRR